MNTRTLARPPVQVDYTPPVAIAVYKRHRLCTVAKLTTFLHDDEVILATAWRGQAGTTQAISLPQSVIDYALAAGARTYYLRDDRSRQMWTCSLDLFERGRLAADGERYIPLSWLSETTWRDWRYAESTVVLTAPARSASADPPVRQLALAFEWRGE